MALTICSSISRNCFRLMRDWKLESLANGEEISVVPFRTEKEEYLPYSTISERNFRKLPYHLTSNRNLRIFCPNGKHPPSTVNVCPLTHNAPGSMNSFIADWLTFSGAQPFPPNGIISKSFCTREATEVRQEPRLSTFKVGTLSWPFLLQNLVAGTNLDQLWPTLVPATCPMNSNQFEFLGQVPATCSSKRFVWTVRWTSCRD